MKLLDTDTCIELLRGNPRVLSRRERDLDLVGTTWINAAELYFGAARSPHPTANRATVDDFLDSLPVIGLDTVAARAYGEIKQMLRSRGLGLADPDLLIGAISLSCDATLVTGNARHYERIPGLEIENWIRD